jgi:phytoene dehydrogenase-like protein
MLDVVIVGGGHNGLVCACYLAEAGLKVAVLERRYTVGGACVTEELFPGYRSSTASLVSSLFREEIVRDLRLKHHGLEFLPREPSVVTVFPDGEHLMLGSDERACAQQIQKFSGADAEAYSRYGQTMRRLAAAMEPYVLGEAPDLSLEDPKALRDELAALVDLPDEDLDNLAAALTGSARGFLNRWFESDAIKVPLVIDGITGVDGGPSTPGTAYLMLYHMTGSTETGRPAWGQIRGGMGGITRALESAARERGVVIRTKADVARVLVDEEGRAGGVVLADGEEIRSRTVASSADPHVTFLKLLEPTHLPEAFRREVQDMDFDGVATKIHLALDGLPEIHGFGGGSGPQHRGTLLIAPSLDYLDDAYADSREGRPSARPHIECTIPSVLDPSLAPEGKHVMGIYVQYTPYSLAEGSWDGIKESYADRVLGCIEEYIPGLTRRVVDRRVYSPLDLERELGLTGGSLYHGSMSPGQLFSKRPVDGYADHRTPVPGLYLCGSGVHPGGGVFGVPGRNAAARIANDLRSSGAVVSEGGTVG